MIDSRRLPVLLLSLLCLAPALALVLRAADPQTPSQVKGEQAISASVLQVEIDAALARLEALAKMQQPDVKKLARSVNRDAATLAALAEVAAVHPQLKNERGLTPALRRASEKLLALRKKSAEEIQSALPRILQQTRKSLKEAAEPADLKPRPISEAVDRGGLMWRMDYALRWVKDNVTEEADFDVHRRRAGHEAAVLAATARLIGTPGYGYAEEAEFQQLRANLEQQAVEIQEHLKSRNLAELKTSLDAARQGCIDCHGDYR